MVTEQHEDYDDPSHCGLLGIDVGFSATRPTTGIAWTNGAGIGAKRAHTAWESRHASTPETFCARMIAIDGPLIPGELSKLVRACELVFQRGLFQRRCKPGMSHFGTGMALRRAANDARSQFATRLCPGGLGATAASSQSRDGIIEAFPNAFLGVMLPETAFDVSVNIRRGKRFDYLYDTARDLGLLERAASALRVPISALVSRMMCERDHELRAAWICLLTAAFAGEGTATTIGDPIGGWFWLPPWGLWAAWAQIAVVQSMEILRAEGRALDLVRGQAPSATR